MAGLWARLRIHRGIGESPQFLGPFHIGVHSLWRSVKRRRIAGDEVRETCATEVGEEEGRRVSGAPV